MKILHRALGSKLSIRKRKFSKVSKTSHWNSNLFECRTNPESEIRTNLSFRQKLIDWKRLSASLARIHFHCCQDLKSFRMKFPFSAICCQFRSDFKSSIAGTNFRWLFEFAVEGLCLYCGSVQTSQLVSQNRPTNNWYVWCDKLSCKLIEIQIFWILRPNSILTLEVGLQIRRFNVDSFENRRFG